MRFEANERGHHGPNRVRIVEVGPRDGLQNIATTVPTSVKVELIQRLVRTGLPAVEVTSFVSPRWIPQLADNKEVLRGIGPLLKDAFVSLSVLVPNVKGLNGALQCEVREVAVFISASEGFSRKNTNCSVSEALSRAREVATRAKTHGIAVRGSVTPPKAGVRHTRLAGALTRVLFVAMSHASSSVRTTARPRRPPCYASRASCSTWAATR